jgi:hypothetical protein
MKGTLEIFELKILKGPDRLLRLHVMIQDSQNITDSLSMLSTIVEAIIWKNHRMETDFPIQQILGAIPESKSIAPGKYGTFFNGALAIEMVLMQRSHSSFKMRYYPEELELERKASDVKLFLLRDGKNLENFDFRYNLGNFREGFSLPELQMKVLFKKE